uniref:Secreted protein n=1 Tax=Knipowitschia caucasica TaxID=637954 RepID=A0AAV2KJJ7_KNICA
MPGKDGVWCTGALLMGSALLNRSRGSRCSALQTHWDLTALFHHVTLSFLPPSPANPAEEGCPRKPAQDEDRRRGGWQRSRPKAPLMFMGMCRSIQQ